MPYIIRHFPPSVYPREMRDECPEAEADIANVIRQMGRQGPSPSGYNVKNLGQKMDGLWQLNLRVSKRQVRILYAPYDSDIVLFRIHKKSSPQEQNRAYDLARSRKRQFDRERERQGRK